MMLVKFGYRTYEIHPEDITKVRKIWASTLGQDDFEDELEKQFIEFTIEY